MTTDGSVRFGYLKLAGGRFDGAEGLPVGSAAELERYAALVSAVARELYLKANQKRKRVPRGFDAGFDLRLTKVTKGSQIPVLVRPARGDQSPLFDTEDWHDDARRLINSVLAEVPTNDRGLDQFPDSAVKYLVQFGRGLRPDERIELSDSKDSPNRAVLDIGVRKRIQKLAKVEGLEVETSVVGRVNGLHSTPPSFELVVTEDGQKRRISGTYSDSAAWELLHRYMGADDTAQLVSVTAIAVQDRAGVISSIKDVLGIDLALPPEWSERLDHLGRLEPGWLHDGSEPPSSDTLQHTERILLAMLDAEIAAPAIYPSGDGGIQLEWRTDSRAIEVEILNEGPVEVAWYGRHTDEDGEDAVFSAGDPDGVADFVKDSIGD